MKELYFNTVQEFNDFYGFEYPQHFVRFFKSHSGITPSEYRKTA
jgi:AraC family transcriptional regulator, transcriptional activator of pobA